MERVSPGIPISRFTTLSPSSSTESNTRMSLRSGSRTAGSRVWMSGTSAPYSALLTNRKSPISSVFSMLPDGIRKASTRKVRRKNQTTSATTIDLVHSHSQMTAERDRSAGPPAGRAEPVEVEAGRACGARGHAWILKGKAESITGCAGQTASRSAFSTLAGCSAGVGHPGPVAADAAVGADPDRGPDHADDLPAVHRLLAVGPVGPHDLPARDRTAG